ncbi:unnamed protein product [Peniophora sp. CBMAI 1063]|nr:unnamed protein product [Peniophora sp. CBMAI 1063]
MSSVSQSQLARPRSCDPAPYYRPRPCSPSSSTDTSRGSSPSSQRRRQSSRHPTSFSAAYHPGSDTGRHRTPPRLNVRAAIRPSNAETDITTKYTLSPSLPRQMRASTSPPSNHSLSRVGSGRPGPSNTGSLLVAHLPAIPASESSSSRHTSTSGADIRQHNASDSVSGGMDTRESASPPDVPADAIPSNLSKRKRSEPTHDQQPTVTQPVPVDDNEDGPIDDDCVVKDHGFEPRPGKEPRKVFFNGKGVKLEILKIDVTIDENAYVKHAEQVPDDPAMWRCTYGKMVNGAPGQCSYESQRHMVKRHVEATHMNIKRFQCSWCRQTFTQRANGLACHINLHSDDNPHACPHCPLRFENSRKLHRHISRDHYAELRLKRQRRRSAQDTP